MTGSRLARAVLAVLLCRALFAFPAAHAGLQAESAGRPCPATRWLRSVWMWHYRQVLRHPQRVVRVLERHGIGRVYLQIAPPLSAFRPFLGRAHEAGIQVFALEGSPGAVLDPAPILKHTAELARFNARPGGLQLDIEPYALKRFWKHQRRYLSAIWVCFRRYDRRPRLDSGCRLRSLRGSVVCDSTSIQCPRSQSALPTRSSS